MKIVYICSPCRGDYEKNIAKAQEYCREAVDMGVLPIAPHVYFTQFLNDFIPAERKTGMDLGIELLKHCDEVWVYGIQNPSEGMAAEIKLAKEIGIPVIDATDAYAKKADQNEREVGSVFFTIPGTETMAIHQGRLEKKPISMEINGRIIIELADKLKRNPGTSLLLGGAEL